MRSLLVIAVLLLTLVPLPGAAAASLAEDPEGDVKTEVFGVDALPAPTPQAKAADLRSLDVEETPEELAFTIKVVDLKQQVNFLSYHVAFSWAKSDYRAIFQRQVVEGVVKDTHGAYFVYENEDGWNEYVNIPATMDVATSTIRMQVPKAYILSDNGRYPLLGDKLQDLHVRAYSSSNFFQFTASATDRMPDGDDTISYAFQFGDVQTGHLRIDADERVRVSNGGSTTFVYKVKISNRGEQDDQVRVELTDLPEGWDARVQSPIRVPAQSERTLAVLVSVPFAHDHGGFSSLNVTARSEGNTNSLASLRLGVLHTPIPQPAGHHSELCLHSRNTGNFFSAFFPFTPGTMNTECDHTADSAEVTPSGRGNGFTWNIPLDPVLRMGLDFDLERLGELGGTILGRNAMEGSLYAELHLSRGIDPETGDSESLLLAESDEIPLTLDLSKPSPFKLTFTPMEEADYVPYVRGQNLVLVLRFEADSDMPTICCFGANTPGLKTEDFKLVLPLNEYHDKLTGASEAAEILELRPVGPVEKAGFPGATLTYAFTLVNNGADAMTVNLDAAGSDALHGTVVPERAVRVGAKESVKVTLAVRIPVEKSQGEELEVLLFAHAQEDPTKSAIARTKTTVAKTGSVDATPDETDVLLAAQAEADRDAPGLGAPLAIVLLAALALWRRR